MMEGENHWIKEKYEEEHIVLSVSTGETGVEMGGEDGGSVLIVGV